ncbi:hypothetical protein MBOT_01180 [Mycobacterium botniense]|uniref:Uncharacterized protein n=1 Tax=Mycobacterium botniense TaxID=84962 RepID=A0A7I9XRX9_9MYCO|nr:hypothetical protein MBOT_01180 [Mycobacterium botniense]
MLCGGSGRSSAKVRHDLDVGTRSIRIVKQIHHIAGCQAGALDAGITDMITTLARLTPNRVSRLAFHATAFYSTNRKLAGLLVSREGCPYAGQASQVHPEFGGQAARPVIETGRLVAHVAAEESPPHRSDTGRAVTPTRHNRHHQPASNRLPAAPPGRAKNRNQDALKIFR